MGLQGTLARCTTPSTALTLYWKGKRIKPIFHQNAKLLALGTFASANAKDSTFALRKKYQHVGISGVG